MTAAGNPFARKQPSGYPAAVANLKQEVERLLDLQGDAVVSIAELACREPGCPEIETVVAIMIDGAPPRLARIHKPIPEVTKQDLHQALNR